MSVPSDLPNPDRYRGSGTVYLGFETDRDGGTVWAGYWDAAPESTDEGITWIQDAGRHPSAASAVAWARERTSRVVIRLLDDAAAQDVRSAYPDANFSNPAYVGAEVGGGHLTFVMEGAGPVGVPGDVVEIKAGFLCGAY
jgi:hypothetical protein